MSKLKLPKLSGDQFMIGLVLLIPTFGPALFSGYKWWIDTHGVDRFAAVGMVAFFEVSLAFGLGIYLTARSSGQKARARGLLIWLAFSAFVSGAMLWKPVADLADNRFPRPETPLTAPYEAELATIDRLESELRAAVTSGDGYAIQASVAAAGGDIGRHGFDGAAGEDTAAAYTAAFASLSQRRFAATKSLTEASFATRAGLLWNGLVTVGVCAILAAVIFARWLLTGVAEGRRPQQDTESVKDTRPGWLITYVKGAPYFEHCLNVLGRAPTSEEANAMLPVRKGYHYRVVESQGRIMSYPDETAERGSNVLVFPARATA